MSIADFNDVGLRLEGGALIDANLASSRAFTSKVFASARSQRARDVNLVIFVPRLEGFDIARRGNVSAMVLTITYHTRPPCVGKAKLPILLIVNNHLRNGPIEARSENFEPLGSPYSNETAGALMLGKGISGRFGLFESNLTME